MVLLVENFVRYRHPPNCRLKIEKKHQLTDANQMWQKNVRLVVLFDKGDGICVMAKHIKKN